MRPVPALFVSDRRLSLRGRGTALLLTLVVHLLLLLLLLRLAPPLVPPPRTGSRTLAFDVAPEAERARPRAAKAAPREARAAERKTPPSARVAKKVDAPERFELPPGFILLTRKEFSDTDVASKPNAGTGKAAEVAGAGDGKDSGAAAGGGGGSEQLHDVDWYRRPTNAELAFYLPRNRRIIGWGMIACQTIADYRVDNCRELDQSPAGSGLARAVREAAWQFRVLPPRIGNRPVIGAWVRIRIEYTENGAR